jgi:hypothetical protein
MCVCDFDFVVGAYNIYMLVNSLIGAQREYVGTYISSEDCKAITPKPNSFTDFADLLAD